MDRKDVREKSRKVLSDGKVKLIELTLDAPRQAGGMMENISREIVLRENAAAALVHDVDRDVFIMAEQFRFPVYERGGGWLLELVAGKIDGDETPEACVIREIEEEIGYRARSVEPITQFFVAPGYSTERMFLFYAPVKASDLVKAEAAGTDEGEDIRRFELPRAEFLDRLDKQDFLDSKVLAMSGWAIKKFG
jgi:ADP-ribose pyrophosphatase